VCVFCIILYIAVTDSVFLKLVIGALAITIANPTDLVKVRLQSEGQLPSGVPRRYSGAIDAYLTILRQVSLSYDFFGSCSFDYVENILIESNSLYICFCETRKE